MSVLRAAMAVRRRRYGVLRFLADYRLILQSALCYARQCDLIKNEEIFMDAMDVSELLTQPTFTRFGNETISFIKTVTIIYFRRQKDMGKKERNKLKGLNTTIVMRENEIYLERSEILGFGKSCRFWKIKIIICDGAQWICWHILSEINLINIACRMHALTFIRFL